MMEKLLLLIDVWTKVGQAALADYAAAAGKPAVVAEEAPAPPVKRARKAKEPVVEAAAPAAAAPTGSDDPFGLGAIPPAAPAAAPSGKPSAEQVVEARRRCTDAVKAFVQRNLNATPKGIDQAKEILQKHAASWKQGVKLEELSYEDHVKLIPVFEKALEATA